MKAAPSACNEGAASNPAPAKWLMAQRGLISSATVRPPLINLTEPGQQRVQQLADAGAAHLTDINGQLLFIYRTHPPARRSPALTEGPSTV